MNSIETFFEKDGVLAKKLENYAPRSEQITLAKKIAEVIANKQILVAEAGTGTGKTFAYLVPSLAEGKKNDYFNRHKEFTRSIILP